MNFIPMSEWSAYPKPGSSLVGPLPLVVIHHSYAPSLPPTATREEEEKALRSIDNYHRKSMNWGGFGYSFAVFQSGRLYEGRGWLRSGAHTAGQNKRSHAVCWIIDGSVNTPTAASIKAVRDLILEGIARGSISKDYDLKPHDHFTPKICPGYRVKSIMSQLRVAIKRPLVRRDDRNEDVRVLQIALHVKPVTGFFGPITEAAVRDYQRRNGLKPDGIVGDRTWESLGV